MLNVFAVLAALMGLNVAEPPADAEVLRALPPVTRGLPLVFEESRDSITIVKNQTGTAKVGPKCLIPLVGPAQVVTTNWECTVFYTEVIRSDFPVPVELKRKRVQVVYMEKAELAK